MRALVTGASYGGIGGAICHRLAGDAAQRGERLSIAISATGRQPGFANLAGELETLGVAVLAVHGDLADPDFPGRLVRQAVDVYGGLDLVVSNAGMSRPEPLAEVDVADWSAMLDVHARAPWLLAKAAFPALRDSKGCFIATGSISGTAPHVGLGAYPVAKAALIMMCQTLAVEWGPSGVRVNVVSPGPIRTPISGKAYSDPDAIRGDAAARAAVIPVGRVGTPDDVAGVVSFLAGPDAAFVTGENILVDGGLTRSGLERISMRRGDHTAGPPSDA